MDPRVTPARFDARKGTRLDSGRFPATRSGGHHRNGLPVPEGRRPGALLGQHPRPARRHHRGPADPLAARGLLRRRPEGARPDLRPAGRVPDAGRFPAHWSSASPRHPSRRPTRRSSSACWSPARRLLDAGYGPERDFDRDRVSVILGVTGTLELVIPLGARLGHPIWRRALHEAGVDEPTAEDVVRRIAESYVGWQENSFPGLLGNVVAGRIANRLDLGGTNCVVDAACASSLGAVNLAMLELAAGRCDVVLTGGLDTFNDIFMYMCFSKTPALSPDGRRPAVRRGGGRHDPGRGPGHPGAEAAGRRRARRRPDLRGDPRDGDVERRQGAGGLRPERRGPGQGAAPGVRPGGGLARRRSSWSRRTAPARRWATRPSSRRSRRSTAGPGPRARWCALGSVKSQIGHTKAAAGAAGLIKAALALHHKVLAADDQGAVGRSSRWPRATRRSTSTPRPGPGCRGTGQPRRAAVSAFGFGGSNFHCVLEEADPAKPGIDWGGDVQILAYSGRDAAEIAAALPRWTDDVAVVDGAAGGGAEPGAVSQPTHPLTARPGRRAREDRAGRADRAGPGAAAVRARRARGNRRPVAPAGRRIEERAVRVGPAARSLAMLFPGQGSQYLGMLRDLACRFPRMHAALALWNDRGRARRRPAQRPDLSPCRRSATRSATARTTALRDTSVAQPAIGAVSLGLLQILEDFGVRRRARGRPQLRRTDGARRGRSDRPEGAREALGPARGADGGMRARTGPRRDARRLRLARSRWPRFVQEHGLDVVIANKNAPKQCVLSGPKPRSERAAGLFADRGVTARPLAVSAAFHSRFVEESGAAFREQPGRDRPGAGADPGLGQCDRRAVSRRSRRRARLAGGAASQPGRVRRADRSHVPDGGADVPRGRARLEAHGAGPVDPRRAGSRRGRGRRDARRYGRGEPRRPGDRARESRRPRVSCGACPLG